MHRIFVLIIALLAASSLFSQQGASVQLTVLTDQNKPLPLTTVELVEKNTRSVLQNKMADSLGRVKFKNIKAGNYFFHSSHSGFTSDTSEFFTLSDTSNLLSTLTLYPEGGILENVTVTSVKSFTELRSGKTVVNLDASITASGSSILEALQKIPGITVDQSGNISLKGKTNVLVLIDDRPTYLSPSQLAALLSGMNSSSVSQVELMDQPPSRYDAAGNAGAINIKTKKNLQKGFSGSASENYVQGKYPKNYNNLQLNYRNNKWNVFASYSKISGNYFTTAYMWRTYYNPNGSVASILEQPSFLKIIYGSQNFRAGIDYNLNSKTTLSATFTGLLLKRDNLSYNRGVWMDPQLKKDSALFTQGIDHNNWKNAGTYVSFRHSFTPSSELTADADFIQYRIRTNQLVTNSLIFPRSNSDTTRGWIPSTIQIFSAKTDYTKQLKNFKFSTGIKISRVSTNNLANYEINYGTQWQPDYGKSNQFLYDERIQAAFVNGEFKQNKWSAEGGLRFEATNYDARQLGNPLQKDSSFSRAYKNLFPSLSASYQADSNNTFSISAGRRIDRPDFQKLNPFIIIMNKYTYQKGNPYYLPQYTWKAELSHTYKNTLVTSLGYSTTSDHFSQIFLQNAGIVTYTEGNLGRFQQLSLTESVQLSPARWWSLSFTGVLVNKKREGIIGKQLYSQITQFDLSINNQLRFKKGWSGEVAGSFLSRSQNDIQEFHDPSGTLSLGVAKTVMKNKGVIKFALRDIFYTYWIKGNTYFFQTTEYFKLQTDSRNALFSFVYRFGKNFQTAKRSEGSSKEETQRIKTD